MQVAGDRGREVSYNMFGPMWSRGELCGGFTKDEAKGEKIFVECQVVELCQGSQSQNKEEILNS